MRLRDKLRGAPSPVAPRRGEPEPPPGRGPDDGPSVGARPLGSNGARFGQDGGGAAHEPGPDSPERSDRIEHLRALIGEVAARERRRSPAVHGEPQSLPVGEARENAHGELHLIERWLDPDHCHGRVPVGGALGVDAGLVARLSLDPELGEVDLSRMLILDTETTGLAGGAGTVPFLVGLAYFDDGVLKVEQLFLRNFGQEAPLLAHLAERVAQASCLVSYNGKSFDWPLLRARFVMNRVPMPEVPPHLDLLHCARRVLRPRMAGVRLTAVEQELLGFHREGDVDGSLIPGLYLGYLRGADPRSLLPVLEHNEHDVIALAAILARLCEHFAEVKPEDDPRDHLAYAQVALRARDLERAEGFARAAAEGGGEVGVSAQAHGLAAKVARRRGDARAAAEAWQRALQVAPCELTAAEAHCALAKLYEHALKDLRRARAHARMTMPAEGPVAHGRRLGRLHRRLLRP